MLSRRVAIHVSILLGVALVVGWSIQLILTSQQAGVVRATAVVKGG